MPGDSRVTGWWHAGPTTWHRYFGPYNLAARKVGPGYYLATVDHVERGRVHESPHGTMRAAKRAAEDWVTSNG